MDTTIAHRSSKERHVGIDAGKQFLDVCLLELELARRVENSAVAITSLLAKPGRYSLTRIVVEHIGGYERSLVEACAAKEFLPRRPPPAPQGAEFLCLLGFL